MVVVLIIVLLAGLVLGGVGYMHKKALDVKCQAQFAVLELAIETYKSDHGYYPRNYDGKPKPPDGSSVPDIIAWKNDSLKKDGAATLARALVERKNDFNKLYINLSLGGQSKFMVNEEGRIVQSGKAGSMPGAERVRNPIGSYYSYRYPGTNNKGGYDLSVHSELGRTYYNWRR